jgi:cytidylate kinase
MGRTIAIDGPSGAGKSTVARMLADILGFRYLDTGALYRAVALGLDRLGIRAEDPDERLAGALADMSLQYANGTVLLDGEDVSAEIRKPLIGHLSSVFSARRPVREFLLPVQKSAALENDLVAEGRDMTTVVFPGAWKKFYLDADVESRVNRRYLQLIKNGVPIDPARAKEDVVDRDRRDSSREFSPLKVAGDAVVIDTSALTIEEVMKRVLEEVRGGE